MHHFHSSEYPSESKYSSESKPEFFFDIAFDTISDATDTLTNARLADTDLDSDETVSGGLDIHVEQMLEAERWSDYDETERPARSRSAGRKQRTAAPATEPASTAPAPKSAPPKPEKQKTSAARVIATDEEGEYSGVLASFYSDELIIGTPMLVKSGKEATVYCCRAHPQMQERTGHEWLAAKVYRSRENRSFKNYSVYQQGRTTMNMRMDKAIAQKSATGLAAQFSMWIGWEYETLARLHKAGADVPRPYAQAESAILFDYYGAPGHAAPQLFHVSLTPEEAGPLFEQMKRNLALMMEFDRVHGDLSPYNILYWEGALRIIDFPQAVDPMDNPDAYALFVRDVTNVCEHFALYGIESHPERLAYGLWVGAGRPKPKM